MTETTALISECTSLFPKYYDTHELEIDEFASELRSRLGKLWLCRDVAGKQREKLRDVLFDLDNNLESYEEASRRKIANIPGSAQELESKKYELTLSFDVVRDFVMDYAQKDASIRPPPPPLPPPQPDDKTERGLKDRIAANPDDPEAYNALGNHYFSQGRYDDAIESYKVAFSKKDDFVFLSNIGDAYRFMAKWDECIDYYRKALEKAPTDAIANNGIASAYYAVGNFEKAKQHYNMAITSDPQAVYLVNLGMTYSAERNWDESIDYFQNALALDANYAPGHSELAWALLSKWYEEGKRNRMLLEDACNHYQSALDIAPNVFGYFHYTGLGEVYYELGQPDKAVECFNESIKLAPNHSRVYNDLGNVYISQGNFASALENYSKAFELNPENHIYAENIGRLYEAQEKWDEAITFYEKAHKINEKDSITLIKLGRACYDSGKRDQARKWFSKLIEMDPGNFLSQYWMGILSMADGHWSEAVPYFEKATQLNSQDAESFFQWGLALYYKALFLRACDKIQQAVKINPAVPEYYEWLAVINSKLRKWDLAIDTANQAIEKASAINPNDDSCKGTLAAVYNEKGKVLYGERKYGDAIGEYRNAIKVMELAVYWWNIYLAYRDWQKPKEAKESIVKAIQLEPKNQQYLDALNQV